MSQKTPLSKKVDTSSDSQPTLNTSQHSSTDDSATLSLSHLGGSGCLDPCSQEFDPSLALQASTIPGLPEVEPLASLRQFENFHSDPEAFKRNEEENKVKKDLKKAAKLREQTEREAAPVSQPQRNRMKNVMIRMANCRGPLSKLRDWMLSQIRVKVIIRSFKGVRGTCTGFVVAFDRYFNLAMTDVDEVYASIHRPEGYVKKKRGDKKCSEVHTDSRNDPEMELLIQRVRCMTVNPCDNVKRRHLNQIFIRGDQVVLVSSTLTKPP